MKKPLRITVINADSEVDTYFRGLGADARFDISMVTAADDDVLASLTSDCEVVVMPAPAAQATRENLSVWLAGHTGVAVYAVAETADLDAVRRLMRAGVSDVLVKPLKDDEIRREMEQVMDKRDATQPGGKLITFLNAKGGNGSTTMAVNTAVELARRETLSVLLVDMDVQFGDAAGALDMHPPSTVLEALSQSDRLDPTLLDSMVWCTDEGLHVLASPARLDPLDSVRPKDMQRLLEVSLQVYDVVIIDLPRIVTNWTSEVMRWSDHIFLVAQGSIASVRDGRLLARHMTGLGVSSDAIHYIHNRAGARHTSVTTDQLSKSLESNRIVVVHNDYDVAIRAADMGKPVVEMARSSTLSRDIHRLADVVAGLCGFERDDHPGLLGRLFGAHGE